MMTEKPQDNPGTGVEFKSLTVGLDIPLVQ